MKVLRCLSAMVLLAASARAETCTTQSAMAPAERDGLVRAGESFATMAAGNQADAVRAQTMPQFAQDFSGIAEAIRTFAAHAAGATFQPDSVWILDASTAKVGADGSPQDAQFFCNLNRGAVGASFLIPALPPGRYGLVVLTASGPAEPYGISLLMRQSTPGTWQLGGMFPRALAVAGHDGLWYWRAARDYTAKKQPWNAYVYYNAAEQLLKPVSFVSSTHLDKLLDERSKSTPSALSGGLGPQQPLVISDGKSAEVRVTSLGADRAPNNAGLDLLAHVHVDAALPDPVAARARNAAAARALLAAYPELRSAFHGVWIVADSPDGGNYTSEEPMNTL